MAILKIHGYQRNETSRSDSPQKSTVVEHVLVEMDSPLDTLATLVFYLPNSASGPGTADFNPLQITFTLNQSRHAEYSNYVFESQGGIKRTNTSDRFWIIPMTYTSGGTGVYGVGTSIPKEKRKDQKVKKPDSPVEADNVPIVDPVDRHPVFSGSSKVVMRQSLFDLNGKIIKHTNGLPITTPVPIAVSQKTWTWEFNVAAADFAVEDFDEIDNCINDGTVGIKQGTSPDTYDIDAYKMKCMGFSYKEVWETPDGSETEYHFVRVTVSFEVSVDPWNTPPTSLHTKQRVGFVNVRLLPIDINAAGDKAKTPWPLDSDGLAITYTDLPTAVEADFGVLQADGDDLVMAELANFENFFFTYKLSLPRVMN